MPLKLKQFLDQLLYLLKEDYPEQLRAIIKDARGLIYLQVLDKESAVIRVDSQAITITNGAKTRGTNVRVYTSRSCLFSILEGRLTLEAAVRVDELRVFGDPSMILRCYGMWEKVVSLARTSPRLYFLTYELR